ncbi:MAG: SGNH/GDSL hydrolase family protein [Bacteroidales bacterium]|nr:SGNH/GDSL hydrolase family protein [Bacteroidales bacterium]
MKRISTFIAILLLAVSSAAFAQPQNGGQRRQLTPEEINAFLARQRSKPSEHHLTPSPGSIPIYAGHKNYGKKIAVFGGSLSVNPESDVAKQIWADLLGAEVTTYGVGGAGFSKGRGYDLQKQVDTAGIYDIYVLWASTNDYTGQAECGTWKDYTSFDNYDESKLSTQCGGINYCIKKIMEKNPKAEIYFFTGLRFFGQDAGHNPFSDAPNKTGKTFADYIQGQKDCCAYNGVPVLDQFNLQGINEFNYSEYYKGDKLHMNEEGYRKIGYVQAAFLADGK